MHVALVKGDIDESEPTLVRVHSTAEANDILGYRKSESEIELHAALQKIEEEGKGIVLFMKQRMHLHRGQLSLQSEHLPDADMNKDYRDYGVGAQILRALNARKLRLMTNNTVKRVGMEGYGLQMTEHVPLDTEKASETIRERVGEAAFLQSIIIEKK